MSRKWNIMCNSKLHVQFLVLVFTDNQNDWDVSKFQWNEATFDHYWNRRNGFPALSVNPAAWICCTRISNMRETTENKKLSRLKIYLEDELLEFSICHFVCQAESETACSLVLQWQYESYCNSSTEVWDWNKARPESYDSLSCFQPSQS